MAIGQKLWHQRFRISAAGAVLLAVALTACSHDDDVVSPLPQGRIAFGVEINNSTSAITRGQPQGGTRFGALPNDIGAFGFMYDTWNSGVEPTYMYNEDLQLYDDKYVTANPYDAPAPGTGTTMRYYAYYPYSDKLDGSENGIKFTGLYEKGLNAGAPKFEFTVAEKVANQVDLLVGESRIGDGGTPETFSIEKPATDWAKQTPILMRHMLTAIKFKVGGTDVEAEKKQKPGIPAGTIKSIKLKNIKYVGVMNFNSSTSEWSAIDNTKLRDFADTLDYQHNGAINVELTDSGHYFLMIPQNLTTAEVTPQIEMVYNDGATEFTLTHDLSGVWQRGKIVTYTLGVTAARKLAMESTRIVDWDDAGTWQGEVSDKSFLKLQTRIENWNESNDTVRGDNYSKTFESYGFFQFDATEATVALGDAFTAPVLTNSKNFEGVTYSSTNSSVAEVDATTGVVTIKAEGEAVIKATHPAVVEGGLTLYAAGEAKYTLTVTAAGGGE